MLDFVVSLLSQKGTLLLEFPRFCLESYRLFGLIPIEQTLALRIIESKLKKRYRPRIVELTETNNGFALRIH